MSKNKYRYSQRMSAAPPMGEVECPPSRHQSPCRCTCLPKVLGGLRRDLENHLRTRQAIFGVAAEVPSQKPLAAITHRCFRTVVRPSNKPILSGCLPCTDFPLGLVLMVCSAALLVYPDRYYSDGMLRVGRLTQRWIASREYGRGQPWPDVRSRSPPATPVRP